MSKIDKEKLEALRIAMVIRDRKADKQIIEEIDDEEEEFLLKNDEFDFETLYNDSEDENDGYFRQKREIEVIPFNIDKERELEKDKNGNILPSNKEEESEYEESDHEYEIGKKEELEEVLNALKTLLSLLPEDQIVEELLLSFPDDSQEFCKVTDAATVLVFTGHENIYQMERNDVISLFECIQEEIGSI